MKSDVGLRVFSLQFRDHQAIQKGERFYELKVVRCESEQRAWELMANMWQATDKELMQQPKKFRIIETTGMEKF
jgi:hypothetical protein